MFQQNLQSCQDIGFINPSYDGTPWVRIGLFRL